MGHSARLQPSGESNMPLTRSSIVSPRHRKVIVFSLIVIIWVLGAAANGRFPLTTRSV